jgi:hypothetical protein
MDINKNDFISDFTFTNQDDQQNKLIKELTLRNTRNHQLITEFETKRLKMLTKQPPTPIPQSHEAHPTAESRPDADPKKCQTTRKSLLLKMKENDCGEITGNELMRAKQEDNRFRLRSSNRSRDLPLSQKQSAVIKTIEEVLGENDDLALRLLPTHPQKLPILSKRAISVDQNYRTEEEAKVLSQSIKLGKGREVREVVAAKVKIELKMGVLGGELSRKLTRIS